MTTAKGDNAQQREAIERLAKEQNAREWETIERLARAGSARWGAEHWKTIDRLTRTGDWRGTTDAHPGDVENIPLDELLATVRQRIAEVQDLAASVEQRADWMIGSDGRYSRGENPDVDAARNAALHVLANVNSACLHLSDLWGC
jgi:hypothetical protein